LPRLREGSTVIPDNGRFHRKTEVDKVAKKAKVALLFPPPYWADFNPIEQTCAKLKRRLRDNASCVLLLFKTRFTLIWFSVFLLIYYISLRTLVRGFGAVGDACPD
jgi:transposase